MHQVYIISISITLLLSSCNTQFSYNKEYRTEIEYHEDIPMDIINNWQLETFRATPSDHSIKITGDKKAPTLNVGNDGSVGGCDGCNTYGGKIIFVDENNFFFSDFFSTSKGCPSSLNQLFNESLRNVNNYSIEYGKLFLKRDSYLLMIFKKIENH